MATFSCNLNPKWSQLIIENKKSFQTYLSLYLNFEPMFSWCFHNFMTFYNFRFSFFKLHNVAPMFSLFVLTLSTYSSLSSRSMYQTVTAYLWLKLLDECAKENPIQEWWLANNYCRHVPVSICRHCKRIYFSLFADIV